MRLMTVVVDPSGLDELRELASGLGVRGATIGEVHTFEELPDGTLEFVAQLRLELVAEDAAAEAMDVALGAWAATAPVTHAQWWATPIASPAPVRADDKDLAAA